MVFVPVTEFLIQYSWGDSEVVEYAPRRRNHWQAKQIAEKLGFECPAYPVENEEGYAIFTRELARVDIGISKEKLTDAGSFSQYGNVQRWRVMRQSISFSAEGYTLKQWEEEERQILDGGVVSENAYHNGVGRFADHR